nr:immunoglobulin heavy chain junction region [Macaca mulatta]MOW23296.1 immunoglobulin heavy chain junction region [Macaca mulatta]MOW23518.1 immunoglobulin heavy chain junction region [Macaca mulatta]MOW23546.1 immunoglobulin heavy chain junction region [Macaca mulatta]MOW23705.1 immunoglobulin heavy chain junction region [Macaca mulatta]
CARWNHGSFDLW